MRGREVRCTLGRFSGSFSFSNKLDLRFGCLLLLWFSSMVAGIEELGDVQDGRSAVLGVTGEVHGTPASLMLLGGGSGQEGAGVLEVVARAGILEQWFGISQDAVPHLAAGSPASGYSAGLLPRCILSPRSMPNEKHWWWSTCHIAPNPPPETDASSDSHETRENFLQILVGCNCMSASRSCNLYLLTKDWTSICDTAWYAVVSPFTSNQFRFRIAAIGSPIFLLLQAWYMVVWNEKQRTIMDLILLKIYFKKMNCKIITQPSPMKVRYGDLPIAQTYHKYEVSDKFNPAAHTRLLLHIDRCAKANLEMGNASKHEQDYMFSSGCTKFFMADDHPVEGTAPLFGFFHQRCTTTPLSLIPRFSSRGPSRLSSVMVLKNLQLSSLKPRMHTPDRPSGEPPAGHQLVWSIKEAFGDCICSNIESVLSTDKRSLFGFIGSLQCHLLVFRSSLCYFVLLGTSILCLALSRHVIL